jgi:hemolysin activation/secretion protein
MIGGPRRRGGLVRTVGRTAVIAGTASAVAGGVQRRQSNKWAAKEQEAQAQQQAIYEQGVADAQAAAAPPPAAAAAPAAAPAAEDPIAQIEKLGKLKEQGLLTEEEFAAQKAKILGL